MTITKYDIILVGAGIVGLSFSLALREKNFAIAIIDHQAIPSNKPLISDQYDLRVSAITPASQQFFKELDVWNAITAQRVSAYRHMHVWDGRGAGEIHFDANMVGKNELGHIIENSIITNALIEKAQQQTAIDWFCPDHVERIIPLPDHIEVVLQSGKVLSGALVVGADGRNSMVKHFGHFPQKEFDYYHEALVATVKIEHAHRQTAIQRFFNNEQSHGTLAFLPLPDPHYSSIVWTMPPVQMQKTKQLAPDALNHWLQASIDNYFGRVEIVSEYRTFPLHFHHAQHYVDTRMALIGDAAHAIHPLAGQGLNLGLYDARYLAQLLIEQKNKNRDLGNRQHLLRYQRHCKTHHSLMIFTVNQLKKLFAQRSPVWHSLRNMGLNLVDRFLPLKKQLIKQAMGI